MSAALAPAHAASPCAFGHSYPEVTSLDVVEGRLVATLGGRYAPRDADAASLRVALDDTGTWHSVPSEAPASAAPMQCPAAPIDEAWIRSEGMNPSQQIGFQQRPTACAADGSTVWGALSFTTIDGPLGGALFEYAEGPDSYDFWRPLILTRYSIGQMTFANDALWFGTIQEGECTGPSPGFGIYRIDVLDARRRDYAYPEPGICGFAPRDMIVHDGNLWIATELGVATLERSSDAGNVWRNFLPDPESAELMRPMSCDDIYEAVLNMPNMFTDEAFDLGFAFDDFWERLSELRPEFVARYLRKLHGH